MNPSVSDPVITPLPKEAPVAASRKLFTIGLPAASDPADHRFALTPEGAQQLIENGFEIVMQRGAAAPIHYPDSRYAECGVKIVERAQAWSADIVIQLSRVNRADVAMMRRGAMLLTLLKPLQATRDDIKALLEAHIITVALDMVEDMDGNRPFADILAEITGRAAIVGAVSLLADSFGGKGILLGGVTGVVPCEVTVIGSGRAARAAAGSAFGNGALVRMFDNDIYSLRRAERDLNCRVVTSALHRRVLLNALRTADVVINTPVEPAMVFDTEAIATMKKGVIIFDLTERAGADFPGVTKCCVGPDMAIPTLKGTQRRVCYTNVVNAVARTTAMALSNSLLTMLTRLVDCDGMTNALRLLPGVRSAVVTFFGKPVNADVAKKAGVRQADINIFLTLS
ncbi:MAG: hypothetical protein K2H74_01725 [Paramuribaculum sp.]|nr:hypothetical protein [Paramuribaculum sp.]